MTLIEKIEDLGCGCDGIAGDKGLIRIDEALSRIETTAGVIAGTEHVALTMAVGRVLVSSVRPLQMVPPFDNAAMDGYAVRTADLTGHGPWMLPVQARVAAGERSVERLAEGRAIRIFTGAPVPDGADAVVMQEQVATSDGTITLEQAPEPQTNIRFAGEDMTVGKTILPAGRRLTPRDIAACAAAGHASVHVRRRVTAALVVTGNEVHRNGPSLEAASIWDVNTPMLSVAMSALGIDLQSTHLVADSRAALQDKLGHLTGRVDLIVTTGGISVGDEDHVKPALAALGGRISFSGVAMKPGKPVSFGRLGRSHWLGLPGNPLSAFVTWSLLGRPLIAKLSGQVGGLPTRRIVVARRQVRHRSGRCEFRLASIVGMDETGRDVVDFGNATHSGRVSTLPDADGLICVPSDIDTLPEGALIEFHPFSQS